MKKYFVTFLLLVASVTSANASSEGHPLKQIDWKFDGIFGTVDRQSAQRGYQVYKEVCSACHSMKRVSFRNLAALGFSEAEVKALAESVTISDGPNDEGQMFDRPGRASDKFPSPFPNEQAARSANNGALPPDLSLIVKARPNGANYIYSLLTGYEDVPAGFKVGEGMHYNPYFPGKQIAMAQPLASEQVSYQDGTLATLDQEARDVVSFLQWASEPEMEQRKRTGIKVMIYLAAFTILFYVAKKRIWARLEKDQE